jgi:hypothetical protein
MVVATLGITQTLAWGSSYYLSAVIADPIAAGLSPVFGSSASSPRRCCCPGCSAPQPGA